MHGMHPAAEFFDMASLLIQYFETLQTDRFQLSFELATYTQKQISRYLLTVVLPQYHQKINSYRQKCRNLKTQGGSKHFTRR